MSITKGPWDTEHSSRNYSWDVVNAAGRYVTRCEYFDDEDDATAKANARAIAAVPDMIEALRQMYGAGLYERFPAESSAPMRNARAALAKATGKDG